MRLDIRCTEALRAVPFRPGDTGYGCGTFEISVKKYEFVVERRWERRIITTDVIEEDLKTEGNLRPQLLVDYIGQEKAKENLKVYIEAAKQRNVHWTMFFFYGPPGLGKTTLAGIIANEMGVHLKVTSGPAIEKPGEMAAILNNLQEHDVLFVDEIHRLNRR